MKLTDPIVIKKGVSDSEKVLFTKHLAVMIKAGLPIDQIFETLVDQTKESYFKKVLKDILVNITNGQSMTKSIQKYPKIFDDFYVNMVQIGEESGTLSENLDYLSKQLNKNYSLKKKIQNALLYPELVLGMALLIGGGISIFVLPKLTDLFSSFNVKLPLMTRILLWFSNVMKDYGILIVIIFFLLVMIFTWLVQIGPIKFWWHKTTLSLPIVGKILRFGQYSQFTRNLGTLLKSGVPINEGLKISSQTNTNNYFKFLLNKISVDVEQGASIADSLKKKEFKIFPALIPKMIEVGEKTGKLDEVLIYLSDFYEEEMDNITKNISVTLEPIMLVVIGLAVAFVALSIITPIYQLTGSIGN